MKEEKLKPTLIVKHSIIEESSKTEIKESNKMVLPKGISNDDISKLEDYEKYFRLKKMGMGIEQLKQKIRIDGLNPEILNFELDELKKYSNSSKSKEQPEKEPEKCKANEKPVNIKKSKIVIPSGINIDEVDIESYRKYYKLLKMGMPTLQLYQKMKNEQLNPLVLEIKLEDLEILKGVSDNQSNETTNNKNENIPEVPLPQKTIPPLPKVETEINQEKKVEEVKINKKLPKFETPQKKLKSLFWVGISTSKVEETVWKDVDCSEITMYI